MNKSFLVAAMLLFGILISLTMGPSQVAAQGPAGSGAAQAAQDDSRSHSMNPMTWIGKDKNSADVANRSDAEKKLTPSLQSQGLLSAHVTATDACTPFVTLEGCLAALHASHTLGLNFVCLRAAVTDVQTGANMSQCKVADGDKTQTLNKAIHQLKPDANAKQAAKDAEQQAKDDLKELGQ